MTTSNFRRHRRLRSSEGMRSLVRETHLGKHDLIYPLFVVESGQDRKPIRSLPGIYQIPLHILEKEIEKIVQLGIQAVLVFGIPDEKDELGSRAYHDHGIVQNSIRKIKDAFPNLIVIADTCLCEYTTHGHCGIVHGERILNDPSLDLLATTAVSQAVAGADIIAPSNMMDGTVAAIRAGLDKAGFQDIPIMAYAVKYASAFYGPFRDAAGSTPTFGDRQTYQMDVGNRFEALREAESDIREGADFLIVKPALAYLDIVRDVRNRHHVPIVTYNVGGEYAMIKAAAQNGWIDERTTVIESLLSMKRAGADLIITYHAMDVLKWLSQSQVIISP